MSWTIFILAGLAVYVWLSHLQEDGHKAARMRVVRTRAIASFQGANRASWLEQRAIPNRRLVRAFGIDNSFTTTDINWHKTFLSEAQQKVQVQGDGWVELFKVAQQALHRARAYTRFEDQEGKHHVPLAKLVRIVTYITIINVLFHVNPTDMVIEDVVTVTDMINELWVQSKDCSRTAISAGDQFLQRTVLARLLRNNAVFSNPRENPLNLIIPAYETMWRVVLLTFVSAGFRVFDRKTMDEFESIVESVPECLGNSEDSGNVRRALAFAQVC